MDYDSRVDPSILDGYKSDLSKMHFDESHPSIIVPKHPYKRYRMRKNVNKTGLNILKEGPVQNSSFAIMNLLSKSEAPNSMHQITPALNSVTLRSTRESRQTATDPSQPQVFRS